MGIIWNNTGALDKDKATAVAKIGYPYGRKRVTPKILTYTYDGFDWKAYINGQLADTSTRPEAGLPSIGEIVIGADYDDMAWLKGSYGEVVCFNAVLSDLDRVAYENYLADKWLPNGLSINGRVVASTATKPTLTTGQPFLEFNEAGIVVDGSGRVTQWNDVSTLGGNRVALPHSNSLLPNTKTIKEKSAVYLDNKSFLRIAADAAPENNPDYVTVMIVVEFDNYDSNSWPGDADQNIFSSKNHNVFRIKKYDGEPEIAGRLINWDGANLFANISNELVYPYEFSKDNLGYVQLSIGTEPSTLMPQGPSRLINNDDQLGICKWDLTGLIPNTTYYGIWKFSRNSNGTSDPHFSLPLSSNNYEYWKNTMQVIREVSVPVQYETARTNEPIPLGSGIYYVELQVISKPANSAIYFGFHDPSIPYTTAVGLSGWTINSAGRKHAKQTGSGNSWGGASSLIDEGDRVGLLYNSDNGSLTVYKNGTLVGIAHNAIIDTPVQLGIAIDRDGAVELMADPITWTNPNVLGTWKALPTVTEVNDASTAFKFKTLPESGSFKLVVGSCNRTGSETETWDKIIEENPNLFIHMGDLHYLNLESTEPQVHAEGLDTTFKSEKLKNLLRNVAWEYKYDNHDAVNATPVKDNPTWPGFMDFYLKANPVRNLGSSNPITDGAYSTFKIGRVQVVVTDLRRQRDRQNMPDSPTKSMLGVEQKAWLKNTLLDYRDDDTVESLLWVSTVLWTADVDDPRGNSLDSGGASWASYPTERAEIANFIYNNQVKNIFFVCADVHMQAIDDGRNSCYITDVDGNRIDPNTIDKAYWMPMLEASPFDQEIYYEGGPFNTNDRDNSGGPYPSYEQSYGVIEVLDIGQNWLQVKMYTMALVPMTNQWVRNTYYTFNMAAELGTPALPPPLDWNGQGNTSNDNGYVGYDNKWNPIYQRFIGAQGQWKQQFMKWKFHNGEWKAIYLQNSINDSEILTARQLNTWTAEPLNWIRVGGKGFKEVSYPENYGGYFEFSRNFSDLFENYASGTYIGNIPTFYGIAGYNGMMTDNQSYVLLPNSVGAGIHFNALYNRDFFLGFWVYIPPTGLADGELVYILSNVAEGKWIGIRQVGEDIRLEINLTPASTLVVTDPNLYLEKGRWNSVGLSIKNEETGRFNNLYVNDRVSAPLTGFYIENMGSTLIDVMVNEPGLSTHLPTISSVYFVTRYLGQSAVDRYMTKPLVEIVMTNTLTNERTQIPPEWRMAVNADTLSFTMPPDTEPGRYNLTIESLDIKSNPLPINIIPTTTKLDSEVITFEDPATLNDKFYLMHKAWGGANGGVVADNIELRDGKLLLWGNGDLYDGDIQGVTRDGAPKFHTHEADPKLGQPWTNRVGGCVVFKERTGFGSYRVTCTIPTELGMCSAFWTFFYNEIYPNDPRYDDYIAEGLHEQGNAEDGYYITRNHEIDIEFPSHLDGGILAEPSFNNMKCNTWRGELQNWDVPPTDPAYWEEYRDNLTPTGENIYDGQEREYRFDWYKDRVEFYIDGELKRTNINTPPKSITVPDIAGYFTFGVWFPSSPLPSKPWLVRPDRAWAGGTVTPDGGRKAMFNRAKMEVSKFEFIPFDTDGLRLEAETYPYGGYRLKSI